MFGGKKYDGSEKCEGKIHQYCFSSIKSDSNLIKKDHCGNR